MHHYINRTIIVIETAYHQCLRKQIRGLMHRYTAAKNAKKAEGAARPKKALSGSAKRRKKEAKRRAAAAAR